MIAEILGFVLSPIGIAFWLTGFVAFVALPVIPALFNVGYKLANFHLWLAMWSISRAAVLVDEHNGTLFKGMTYYGIGVEKINVSGTMKAFEDPAQALHNWMGFPFALALERDGVLFDPRHAAIGRAKSYYHDHELGSVIATEKDYNDYGVDKWMPGVFEIPKDHELVDLSNVEWLPTGGEKSEYPDLVERYWQLSRIALGDKSFRGAMRPLIIAGILFGGLIFMWQFKSMAGSQSSSDGGSTVTFGVIALLSLPVTMDMDWKKVLAYGVSVSVVGLIMLGLFVLMGPVLFIVSGFLFGMGFTFPLFVLFLFRAAGKADALGDILLKTGLVAYDKPVFEWTPRSYRLREFRNLGGVAEVNWYGLKGNQIGFTFRPEPESFGAEYVDREELENGMEVESGSSILPNGYVRCPSLKWKKYGAYVPKRLDSDKMYLNAGIALSRFRDSAMGEKSENALRKSKDEEGLDGDVGMSNKWFYIGCTISALASVTFGYLIFF